MPLRDSPTPGFLKIMRDRTERRQAEAALAAAHHRTSEILESITDAFYAVGSDWRLTYVNRCTEQLWGKPRDQLLGRRLWEVFSGVAGLDATEDYRLHAQAARGRAPVQAEFRSAVLGSWVSVSLYPQNDGGLSVYFRDIGARKEAEERQALLLHELAHRVKNTLALVLSLARQTGARATTVASFLHLFEGRLRALAVVQELLTENGWRSASLVELARMVLAAHGGPGEEDGGKRITIALEDDVALQPATVQDLVLILHELATNAAKHGALAVPGGSVTLEGRVEDDARSWSGVRTAARRWPSRTSAASAPPCLSTPSSTNRAGGLSSIGSGRKVSPAPCTCRSRRSWRGQASGTDLSFS